MKYFSVIPLLLCVHIPSSGKDCDSSYPELSFSAPPFFLTAVNLGQRDSSLSAHQDLKVHTLTWRGGCSRGCVIIHWVLCWRKEGRPRPEGWQEGQERAQHGASTALPWRVCILLLLLLGVAITCNVKTTSTPIPNRHHPPPLCSTQEENCGEILLNYHTT